MNIRQIQSFITVADAKSFSEAAAIMYTSISQISKLVKGFEEELGYVLFERKKNGVALTPEGMKIYNIANRILRDIDELELIKERKGRESLVVLGLPDVSLDKEFIDHINEKQDHDCFYNLSYTSIESACQDLHVRRADIGFAYVDKIRLTAVRMRLADYALEFIPLIKSRKYLFTGSSHHLARTKTVSMSCLEGQEQIKVNGTDFLNAEHDRSDEITGVARPAMKMLTCNLSTVLSILRNTDMVYIGCDVFDHINVTEGICRIPFEESEADVEFGYIKRHNLELSETARCFVDFVKERIDMII